MHDYNVKTGRISGIAGWKTDAPLYETGLSHYSDAKRFLASRSRLHWLLRTNDLGQALIHNRDEVVVHGNSQSDRDQIIG